MAITLFTGPPGSGKSHALVKDVIVPAILAGRRVLSNIDGIDPDAIKSHCLGMVDDAGTLGTVEVFHGEDAVKPGFWPDESIPDTNTIVKGGDLVVFDEWALYFPSRGKWPVGCNVEPFLRWHRHITGKNGAATDVAVGTQLATDFHNNIRGLVVKSYKFRKLTALGAQGTYSWYLFEGHLQPKNGYYRTGTGKYDKAIFPLYASSSAAKEGTHVELKTNKKESIWSGWQAWGVMIGAPLLILGGAYGVYAAYSGANPKTEAGAASSGQALAPGQTQQAATNAQTPLPISGSPWRIAGYVDGEAGQRVVLIDDKGSTRIVTPGGFQFDDGRPVSGLVDGKLVKSEDRVSAGPTILGGALGQ